MKGVNAYQTFGMAEEWLDEFFLDPESWWRTNSRGPRQFEAMRVWLKHADIVSGKGNCLTDVGKALQRLGSSSPLVWAAIWANLARNSALVRWYVLNVPFGVSWTKPELVELMGETLPLRTRNNALTSLVRLLTETPLGDELGLGRPVSHVRSGRSFLKAGVNQVDPRAVLYSLFRYAEQIGRYDLTLEELFASSQGEGPAALFGISRDLMIRMLRGLSTTHGAWIRVDLVRDLDSIYLESSKRAADALQSS